MADLEPEENEAAEPAEDGTLVWNSWRSYSTQHLRVAAERAHAHDGIAIYMIDRPPAPGPKRIVTNFLLEPMDESAAATWIDPAVVITRAAAKSITRALRIDQTALRLAINL